MPRKSLCALVLIFCCAPLTFSQDNFRRVEVFGGYSHLRADVSNFTVFGPDAREGFNGFHAQVAGNINGIFGIAGDVSGHYNSFDPRFFGGIPEVRVVSVKSSIYSFLGGPQLKARTRHVTPFAHALFGAARTSTTFVSEDIIPSNNFGGTSTQTETSFAFALGGGLDLNVSDRVAIRAAQVDYLQTRFDPNLIAFKNTQHNLRISVGLVIK